MMILIFGSALLVVLLVTGYVFSPYKHPLPTESDWTYHCSPWWQLYYSSKYLSPVKQPARNSGLARYFAADMQPRHNKEGFVVESTATLSAVGDLMCRRDLQGAAGDHLWDLVGEELFSADLKIGNLEFAVSHERLIEKLVRYSVPESYALPLLGDQRFGKFNMLSLGNNHINDNHSRGVVSTCEFLERQGIPFTGANRSALEQDRIRMVTCNNITMAVLSYTFTTNGIPPDPGCDYNVNLVRFNALDDKNYDPSLIKRHIAMAREQGAEVVVACMHWGVEFEYYPPARLVKRAHDLLDAGIDIIIGHHPHILNLSERYITRDGRETFVCYSLGSLTTYALIFPIMRLSHLVKINLLRGRDKAGKPAVRIDDVTFMPIFHSMNKVNGAMVHRLLPVIRMVEMMKSGTAPEYLSGRDRKRLLTVYREHAKYFRQTGFGYI
jgi:poly-gamma-glutamate synthesis protein (capsule biosynthesis protein)